MAEEAAAETGADEVMTVVATRTEQSVDEVAATVSVKTAEEIERELARDIDDLVRFEPGVTVGGNGRFGLSGFSIRGIGGNRVLTMVDGIRVPEEFSFGPFLNAGRDFVDVDSLKRVEIARGPISSLYGSDALGGVVALATKGPADYLGEDRDVAATIKGGYSGDDDSTVGTVTVAGRKGGFGGSVLYTARSAAETRNAGGSDALGSGRELPDPQSIEVDNVSVKATYSPSDSHALTLAVGGYRQDADTNLLSDYGTVAFGAVIQERRAADSRRRDRVSLGYRYTAAGGFAERVDAIVYTQQSETEQATRERRLSPRRTMERRSRDSLHAQRIDGLGIQFGKAFETGALGHYLSYGADYYATRNESLRGGATFDAEGVLQREFMPLPTRDFPLTETDALAVFVQDEIALFDGRLLLSPSIRFDRFSAEAKADDVYLSGNPGSPLPEDYSDAEATFKVGAVFQASEHVVAYARHSEGFRAPPYDDVNVGFTNFIGGYKSIANADLESEHSTGLEVGVRVRGGRGALGWRAELAAFRNDYENFIEALALAPQFAASRGIDPADGLRTFQSVNRDSVRVSGLEFGGSVTIGRAVDLRAAIAYAEGTNETSGLPLSSVEPLSGVLGLRYSRGERWGAELVWTLVQGKDEADIDPADMRVSTSGYGVVDLLAHAHLGERTTFNVGFFNITDRRYLRWADTLAIVDSTPGGFAQPSQDAPGRFTQPGFNVGATVRVRL